VYGTRCLDGWPIPELGIPLQGGVLLQGCRVYGGWGDLSSEPHEDSEGIPGRDYLESAQELVSDFTGLFHLDAIVELWGLVKEPCRSLIIESCYTSLGSLGLGSRRRNDGLSSIVKQNGVLSVFVWGGVLSKTGPSQRNPSTGR